MSFNAKAVNLFAQPHVQLHVAGSMAAPPSGSCLDVQLPQLCMGPSIFQRCCSGVAARPGHVARYLGPAKQIRETGRRAIVVRAGIHIDRRRHLDELWRRQEEAEAREAEAEVTCPIDCVQEVRTLAEFERVLQEAESTNELVVVDFYNPSCGACRHILPQYIKLCKRGCGEECPVGQWTGIRFVKHNVRDEYDDLTDGCRVEQFPTRNRRRLEQFISTIIARQQE